MGEPTKTMTNIAQFNGMISNMDPRDVPPGQSVRQINVMVTRPGELNVRRGLRELAFDDE